MKPIFCAIASLALLTHFSSGQILIDDAMEGYPTATAASVFPGAANPNPFDWQSLVFSGGWGFDAGNTLDIDNIKLTATTPTTYLPVTYDANGFFNLNSGQSSYVGYKPDSYSHSTPTSLFVWMHGCGGNAAGDMWTIAPPATRQTQSYIAISIGGRDGACWSVNSDSPKVLAAIDDIARYFNINPRKIFLGGYSSGGDLAYLVGFQNASRFAGLLVENSDPFRDTGATGTQLMSAASWKINIAHLAHLSDTTYPISTVRTNVASLNSNGFPATLIEKAGAHYNADNGSFGTNYDLKTFLLPYLDAGWQSPVANTLSFSTDVDGDGLSDAAEFAWKDLGFDWQTSQPILVAEFLANATRAGLYTQAQLQALSVGTPLIACDPITGMVKLTIGLKKSVDLVNFNSLPLSAGATAINGDGDLEFTFSPPDDAAFFRLQAR